MTAPLAARTLIGVAAAVILGLGAAHLVLTFRGRAFDPRDGELEARMRETSPRLTAETTLWRAWIGFNASHALGAMLFGVVFGYLAAARWEVLRDSPFLLGVGGLTLCGYLALARAYWFSVPRRGIALATGCYVAGASLALLA